MQKLSEVEGRILKLLSGVMMLLLGVTIIGAPELLQSVLTAVALLVGAVGLTTLIVICDRWIGRRLIDRCAANGPTASDETREVPETTNQPGGMGRAGINSATPRKKTPGTGRHVEAKQGETSPNDHVAV